MAEIDDVTEKNDVSSAIDDIKDSVAAFTYVATA